MKLGLLITIGAVSMLASCSVEVPEIDENAVEELMNMTVEPHIRILDYGPDNGWREHVNARLYNGGFDGLHNIRDLLEADSILISTGYNRSIINPAIAHKFTQINQEEEIAHYIFAKPRLIEYTIDFVSKESLEFHDLKTGDQPLYRNVTFLYTKEPTEWGRRLFSYEDLNLSEEPMHFKSMTIYKTGYFIKYNPETKMWEIVEKANIVYPSELYDRSEPYDDPYYYSPYQAHIMQKSTTSAELNSLQE